MKLNAKDLWSGGLLIALAAIGLWLNLDHTLGSARRMGPGYMPMMVFWLMMGLAGIVFVLGLFNGPDPLEKWSKLDVVSVLLCIGIGIGSYPIIVALAPKLAQNWYALGFAMMLAMAALAMSPGWRPLAFISAAFTVFGLLLDKGGLFLAIIGTVVISALADKDHRPLGVVGLCAALIALCWWVFIRELDIRVEIWPSF